MTTATLNKHTAQTCQWRGIPIAGIHADSSCSREATLTGDDNSISDAHHLCTQHMKQRRTAGYGYVYVWPCSANGFVRTAETARVLGNTSRALSPAALAMTR